MPLLNPIYVLELFHNYRQAKQSRSTSLVTDHFIANRLHNTGVDGRAPLGTLLYPGEGSFNQVLWGHLLRSKIDFAKVRYTDGWLLKGPQTSFHLYMFKYELIFLPSGGGKRLKKDCWKRVE